MDVPISIPFKAVILNEVKDPCISSFFFLSAAGIPDVIPRSGEVEQ
jgi:hypothetical protein